MSQSSIITLNAGASNQTSVTLVSLPSRPGFKAIEPGVFDPVSTVTSPWTGQTQRQYWAGGDRWSAKCALPPLQGDDVDEWEAWLLAMTGMLNAVQLGYPNRRRPRGVVDSQSAPVVDGSVSANNAVGARTLYTKGWKPGTHLLLRSNDAFQLGYRYHRVLGDVNADSNGKAVLSIWPGLREKPADGTPLVLNNPKVLFGLANNNRHWGLRLPMIADISFDLVEFR